MRTTRMTSRTIRIMIHSWKGGREKRRRGRERGREGGREGGRGRKGGRKGGKERGKGRERKCQVLPLQTAHCDKP